MTAGMRMTWSALVVAAGVALVGCGGGGVAINTTQDNVCEEVAAVACHNMFQCCAETEIEALLGVTTPRDEAGCKADFQATCTRQTADLQFSAKNKRVKFDSDAMNKCLEALIAPDNTCVSVEDMLPWTQACMDSAWVGTVAAGGTCDFADECVKDTFCRQDRQCIALPTTGQDCQLDAPCASGLFCDFATNKCAAKLAAGGACTGNNACADGLFCDETAAAGAVCTARHLAGEHCTNNTSCTDGNVCLPGTCQNALTACQSDNDCNHHCEVSGDPCTLDRDCGTGACSITTGTACLANTGCPAGETCVFPEKCVGDTCEGNIVCAAANVTVDYCQGAVTALPF